MMNPWMCHRPRMRAIYYPPSSQDAWCFNGNESGYWVARLRGP
jgi:hypothetical protein